MITPIFVYEPRDLRIFETSDDAELSIEAIDVMNGDLFLFDAAGTLLNAAVKNEYSRIRLVANPAAPRCPEGLRRIIIEYLIGRNFRREMIECASLSELVEMVRGVRRLR